MLIRDVPRQERWGTILLTSVLVLAAGVCLWEAGLRRAGYRPSLSLQDALWARQRNRLSDSPPGQTVLLGSSRMQFGFDLDEWARLSGGDRPFMLAWPGGCPRPVLHDLAEDESFTGTVICGYTPGLFFAPEEFEFPMRTRKLAKYATRWGPADRVGQWLRFLVEPRLALLLDSEVALIPFLRERTSLPQRQGQLTPLRYSARMASLGEDCRVTIYDSFLTDEAEQKRVTDNWMAASERGALYELSDDDLEALLDQIGRDVDRIRERGGRVVFVRYPSTAWFRETETANHPREMFWDRLVQSTGCVGVHFEDHPGLSGFDCPEWSHLGREDATRFTRELFGILSKQHP